MLFTHAVVAEKYPPISGGFLLGLERSALNRLIEYVDYAIPFGANLVRAISKVVWGNMSQ